jgi:hypothetical protein
MLMRLFFALFIVVVRQNVFGVLLGCNHCRNLLVYHFIVTEETVPSDFLRECNLLMSQQSCTIDLQIDLDKKQTIMNVTASTKYVETSITAIEAIENGTQHKRYISFWCSDPRGRCNGVHYLKRVLQSVTIEGSFKELEPILNPTNETIDNSSCLVFSNTTTTKCQSECSDDNKACYIESSTDVEKSSEICARCSSMNDYHLIHSKTFFINNLSISQPDSQRLSCAVPHCNSVANLERIRQLVTIDFNETTWFDTSTTTVIPPTTTTTTNISCGSIIWINDLKKYYTVFILLTTSLVYNIMLS